MAKSKKPFAIVCDLDDCILNFLRLLVVIHNKKYGTCLTTNDIKKWDFVDLNMVDAMGNVVKGHELRQTFLDYESNGIYAALEVMGQADLALDLIKHMGYQIIVLTARDEKFGKDTEISLITNRIHKFVDKLMFSRDKAKVIKELSKEYHVCCFIDDKASTVQNVYENCKVDNVFLMSRPHNEDEELDPEIKVVSDLMDMVRYLKKVN